MGAFLLALAPLLAGITGPIKDWFGYKVEASKAEQEYKLAALKAQSEAIVAERSAETSQLASRLEATTKEFKQNTFWLLCVPIIFTMLFPKRATEMWHNFSLIPDFFQWLFLSVYSAIWGIPIVKGGYGAVTDLLASRREYKLERAKINRDAVFKALKAKIFLKGMTQAQVDSINAALDLGEQ